MDKQNPTWDQSTPWALGLHPDAVPARPPPAGTLSSPPPFGSLLGERSRASPTYCEAEKCPLKEKAGSQHSCIRSGTIQAGRRHGAPSGTAGDLPRTALGTPTPCSPTPPRLPHKTSRMLWKGQTQLPDRSSLRPRAGAAKARSYGHSQPLVSPHQEQLSSLASSRHRPASPTADPPSKRVRSPNGPPVAEGPGMPSRSAPRPHQAGAPPGQQGGGGQGS